MITDGKTLSDCLSQINVTLAAGASEKKRNAPTTILNRFLLSHNNGWAKHMAQAQPEDIVDFLCW